MYDLEIAFYNACKTAKHTVQVMGEQSRIYTKRHINHIRMHPTEHPCKK